MFKFSTLKNLHRNRLVRNIVKISLFPALMLISAHVFADTTGTDLLKDTDANLKATINGTGKEYLYIAELIIATVGFIQTRNPKMFLGILILSVGFNVLLKIAGIEAI